MAVVVFDSRNLKNECRKTLQRCQVMGLDLCAVTKGVAANRLICDILHRVGIENVADARLENLSKLDTHCFAGKHILLRSVASDAIQAMALATHSVHSSVESIKAFDQAANSARGKRHAVCIAVEIGELREGFPIDYLKDVLALIKRLRNIDFGGVFFHRGCLNLNPLDNPSIASIRLALELCQQVFRGAEPMVVAIGGSNTVFESSIPPGCFNLACVGEQLWLPSRGSHEKALVENSTPFVEADILELYSKNGSHRCVVCLGEIDTHVDGLISREGGEVVCATSDHLVLNVPPDSPLHLRKTASFSISYRSLSRLMASPYTEVKLLPE